MRWLFTCHTPGFRSWQLPISILSIIITGRTHTQEGLILALPFSPLQHPTRASPNPSSHTHYLSASQYPISTPQLRHPPHHHQHNQPTTHNVSQERSATPQSAFPTAATDKTTDAFPSSAAFDAINASLSSDDAGRKDAIKKGGAVFAFTLKNAAGDTDSWHIDLKEKGCVGKGEAPEGGKANGE